MRNPLSIATDGYLSNYNRTLAIATNGYLSTYAIAVIPIVRTKTQGDDAEKDKRYNGEYQHLFRERKLQEDEDMLLMMNLITKILYK